MPHWWVKTKEKNNKFGDPETTGSEIESDEELTCAVRMRRFYYPNDRDMEVARIKYKKVQKRQRIKLLLFFHQETRENCEKKLKIQSAVLLYVTIWMIIYGILCIRARRFNNLCDPDTCQTTPYNNCYILDSQMLEFFSEYEENNPEEFNIEDWDVHIQEYQEM